MEGRQAVDANQIGALAAVQLRHARACR